MTKRLLITAALFLSVLNYAQVKTNEPTTPTPTKIKVYTPSGAAGSQKSSKDNSYKWDVKTDLFAIVSGEFPLIGEYRFARKFSVEASAGVTYAYLSNNDLFSNNTNDTYSNDNTKAAMGTAFRGNIKFYPSSDYDAIEGWNFGIQVFSKTTNRDYNLSGDAGVALNGFKDSKTKTGVSLIIGKQIFQDSNVTFESFVGVGFANIKREVSTADYDSSTSKYTVSTFTTTETKPNVQLGFRIGFGN
ncbi:MAG: hypothetical protein WCJ62_02845 [Flavobacterium sp.]